MKDELSTANDREEDARGIPSHAHPEWIVFLDGHRLIDRPRNLREWLKHIFRRPRRPT